MPRADCTSSTPQVALGELGCESEDVNGDGTANVLDLIDLLLAFGTACP